MVSFVHQSLFTSKFSCFPVLKSPVAQVPAIRLPDAPLIEAAEHQSEHESLPSMPSPSKRRKLDAGLGSTKSAIHVGVALPSPERGREIDARWLAETGITRPMQSLNTQSGLEPAGHDALRSRNDDDEDPREAADAPRRNITKQMRLDGKGGMSLPPAPIMLLSRKVGKVVDQRLMRPRPGKRKCTVAAIRYGVEDDVVRERIMNCINAIFAIPPNPSGTHLEAPLSTLIKSVPPICSKPHHPFFTEQRGANKHKTLKDVGDVAMNRTPPPPIASPTCGIFRSFATPKRMRLKTSEENAQSPPMRRLDTFRLPGTHEPLWPCGELFQVGRRGIRSQDVAAYNLSSARNTSRKLKYKTMAVAPTENILRIQMQSVTAANNTNISKNIEIPQRMVMSGLQLRSILGPDLRYRYNRDGFMSTPNDPRHQDLLKPNKPPAHAALQHLYKQLPHILGPFDRTESEMLTWTQKYAPKSAEAVLQIGKDMHVLRSWLEGLTVNSIERQSKDQTTKLEEKIARKKKRKTRSELGDFIVESDDDLTSMLDLNDAQGENKHATLDSSRSVIRDATENTKDTKNPNIVLLSGPSGCGKTAAVYAVAKELGFDVFELNAGSRRSRKDVLDRVGDMTQNHLVHQPDQKPSRLEALQCDKSIAESTPDDKQRSLQSFFGKVGPKVRKNLTSTMDISEGRAKSRDTKNLKQSLILLEEVDILFEEDKQFWETVLALASQSKRPIIMTCNDETSVPLQLFSLHAILRFRRPPQDLAVEYLRLIAACEGHLLKRQPVELLYSSTNQDFRASLSQLNFWCQMGLGDRKGGFEWLLKRWPKGCDVGVDGRKLRVISAGTYKEDQGQHNDLTDITGIRDPRFAEDNATQLWSQQHICPADLTENKSTAIFASWGLSQAESDTVNNCLMGLNSLAIISDAQSAADIFCKTDMPSMDMVRLIHKHDYN